MEESKNFVFVTPKIDTTSSVFLTPPFSDETSLSKTVSYRDMDVHHFPLIKNLVLSPKALIKQDDIVVDLDIISLLYLQGYPLVVKKIIDHLPQSDLLNCLLVCSHWNNFCTTLKRFPLNQKEGNNQVIIKDNIKKQTERFTVLAVRKSNVQPQMRSNVPKPAPTMKRAKCPHCSSPAKEYTFVHAECSSCSHSFCPLCLGKAHKDDLRCEKKISPSKRHFEVGTKQSKKRLRRL